ncbi:hypothetical protein TC41_1602 [Alicyclobacillus acidocaldarius subsp. acidocaldarius Tc-4-1]|uniref:Uncharacterized protein n=1 Tax=Alicyclobacillus acidocaldarius (strain Tc-4-1) TaxID=1048834 RepID=F8IK20_ALIAT|nr:hypothetical protein TC41_1602 [Alicyclobacillus acidocaldarius subsp. acidocaldarius Tc-4-1]
MRILHQLHDLLDYGFNALVRGIDPHRVLGHAKRSDGPFGILAIPLDYVLTISSSDTS